MEIKLTFVGKKDSEDPRKRVIDPEIKGVTKEGEGLRYPEKDMVFTLLEDKWGGEGC